MNSLKPVILLAAHGERGGAANNERLAQLTAEVQVLLPEADVGSVLVNVEGVVPAALAACGERPVIGLPLLFSDGFFHTQRLKPFFTGQAHRLSQPMALWPSFAPFLADNIAHRLISQSSDPRVVLVAHGSKVTGRSAECARRVAGQMQGRYGQVSVGFLEEAPFAADVIRAAEPPFAMVGLFYGAGMHGTEDFDLLVSGAPNLPIAAFTVGELPGLASLVAAEAAQRLRDFSGG